MTSRPDGGPRHELESPLVHIANSRAFYMPLNFLQKSMLFQVHQGKIVYCGQRDDTSESALNDAHSCFLCGSVLASRSEVDEGASSSKADSSMDYCMCCRGMITVDSVAASCNQCSSFICVTCIALDNDLSRKTPDQLKIILQSENRDISSGGLSKMKMVELIMEMRRQRKVKRLALNCGDLDLHSRGTPPDVGAIMLRVGTLNLMRAPPSVRVNRNGSPLEEILNTSLTSLIPTAEQPILDDDGKFEIELPENAPTDLGIEWSTDKIEGGDGKRMIKVENIDVSSEGRRLGILKGDLLQQVNGDNVDILLLSVWLSSRPVYLQFSRPSPCQAGGSSPSYQQPPSPPLLVIYHQPGYPGDIEARHSIAELQKSGPAAYLRKMQSLNQLKRPNQLETALNISFTKKDVEKVCFTKASNLNARIDTRRASRVRAISPQQPKNWNSTGLLLLVSFFRTNSRTNARHSAATRKNVKQKFLRKMKIHSERTALVNPFIQRNRVKIKTYQEKSASGDIEVSDDASYAVLAAVANIKASEAARQEQKWIQTHEDKACKQHTPAVRIGLLLDRNLSKKNNGPFNLVIVMCCFCCNSDNNSEIQRI